MEDRLDQGAAGARRETYACLGTVGAEEEHVAVRQRRWCFPALLSRQGQPPVGRVPRAQWGASPECVVRLAQTSRMCGVRGNDAG